MGLIDKIWAAISHGEETPPSYPSEEVRIMRETEILKSMFNLMVRLSIVDKVEGAITVVGFWNPTIVHGSATVAYLLVDKHRVKKIKKHSNSTYDF